MTKCSEVASELRKLADALDKGGNLKLQRPYIHFMCSSDKESFLNVVKVLPRPIEKKYDDSNSERDCVKVTYDAEALWVQASAYRNLVCSIKEPAKPAVYDCEPLLSQIEEEQVA